MVRTSALTQSLLVATLAAIFNVPLWAQSSPGLRGSTTGSAPFHFAFIGDVPYDELQEEKLDRVIAQVNSDNKLVWVLHAGDIKGGSSECTNETYYQRFEQYQKFDAPFVYTPGDNEWTDCHRVNNGSYDPLERLAFLRTVFYPVPGHTSGGRPMEVMTQADDEGFEEYVENVMWIRSRVIFATLHVVGSNNDLNPWSGRYPDDTRENPRPERIAEFQARKAAVLAWIEKAFNFARQLGSPGVLFLMQANPRFEESPNAPEGFQEIIDALCDRSVEFAKPVVVAHGDTHYFRVDKPLEADTNGFGLQTLENFTRVENFGNPNVHWVRVTVDPKSANVFSFEPVIVPQNNFPRD